MPPFPPSRMNKRKAEKNPAFFPLQKLEKITKFLQSAKVTQKKKKRKKKKENPTPLPLHLQIKVY
jgi:hypothetical protein